MEHFAPADLGATIFTERYARNGEETWEEAAKRVAEHVAAAEDNGKVKDYSERFFEQIAAGRFFPGGRIMYGAGRPKAQLLNCFVIPTSDSREGWAKTTADVIIISSLMGGVGANLTSIRPRGSIIKGTGGRATGAVSLGRLINGVGNEIVGGGGRRMALMLCLAVNHPDLPEFLDAKLNRDEINNANISVVINFDTDEFIQKVKNGEDIEFEFNNTSWPNRVEVNGELQESYSINARDLWNKIVQNAWDNGEPGVLNQDLANKMNNIWYYSDLVSTNPCVTGDTWVHTVHGPQRVVDLLDRAHLLVVDGKPQPTSGVGFFSTGVKPVYTLNTFEGYNVNLTANHKILLDNGEWVEAQHLSEGDKIVLNNHTSFENWDGDGGTFDEGYVAGHFLGDGTWAAGRARMESWGESLGEQFTRSNITEKLDKEWNPVSARGSYTLLTDVPRLSIGVKAITDEVHRASSDYQRGFLRGLFDTDGHVEGSSTAGGISIRLSQSNLDTIHDAQRMLLRFGIRSKINLARNEQLYLLPDGQGGRREYPVKTQWRLIITSDCDQFMDRIGFDNYEKTQKYEAARQEMKRGFYRKAFVATFASLEYIGEEEVYDVQIPSANAFDANGLYVHNCGEIWLEPYGCCDLGAIVLPRFVQDKKFDWDALDETIRLGVRFLDDVLTVNHYPLEEIKANCENVRRIGLGVMGLHTMLMAMGMRYNSEESFAFVDKLFSTIKNTAYDASINLAIEKGPFPAYDPRLLDSGFAKTLKRGIRNKIKEHGLRNCALLTIAPTGTTSIVAGVSSGIEPIPAPVHWRTFFKNTADGKRSRQRELVVDRSYALYPDVIQGAADIPVEDHFKMQKIVQRHIDNAVSKTINLPHDYDPQSLAELWLEYMPYMKGSTFYRWSSREFEPISPVPRQEWEKVMSEQNGHTKYDFDVEEILAIDCPGGVCELPEQWEREVTLAKTK